MKVGDIVNSTSIRTVYDKDIAVQWLDYKADKGRRLVFMFLGTEPRDGSDKLDVVQRMNDLGWSSPVQDELKEMHKELESGQDGNATAC